MYIGPSTEDPPMANPQITRKAINHPQFHATAHPIEETRYRTANTRRLSRLPYLSPGIPAVIAPMIVPNNALETVSPSVAGVKWNSSVNASVVPEITTVSNPNNNPPNAATTVLRSRFA